MSTFQFINYHKGVDCRTVMKDCPYLYFVGRSVISEKIHIIICRYFNVVLHFYLVKLKGDVNLKIKLIEILWECPYLQIKRLKGEYSNVEATIIPNDFKY